LKVQITQKSERWRPPRNTGSKMLRCSQHSRRRSLESPYPWQWHTSAALATRPYIHIGLVSVRLGTTVRRCDQRRGPMDSQSYQRVHTTYYIAYIINPTSKMYVTTSPTHIPTRIHTVRPLHRRHSNHERTAIGTIERHNRRCATRDSCTPAQERMDCT
jgi:hypothetical protein